MNNGLRVGTQRRASYPQLVVGRDEQPPREWGSQAKLVISGESNDHTALIMKKQGPLGASNVAYDFSHRSNNTSLLLYGYDGATFKNFLLLDWANTRVEVIPAAVGPALLRVGNSYAGAHPVHGLLAAAASNWASFGHWDRQGTNDYAFMQNGDGRTLVNATTGQSVRIGVNGADNGIVVDGARIINRVDLDQYGSLHMRDNWVRSYGDTGWYSQTYGGGVWMNDATWVKVYGGKGFYVDNEIKVAAGVGFNARDIAFVGPSGAHGTAYAQFSHWAYRGDVGGFGFMHSNVGYCFVSAASGQAIAFRINNNTKMLIGNDSIEFYTNPALYDRTIRSRAWNDTWHEWGWWSGNDGLRVTEYGGLYYRVRDMDPAFEIFAYASARFNRFDQLGGWDTGVIQARSSGGGSPAMVSWWAAGQNAAHLIKNWYSALEARSWDNAGWGIFRGELEDYSSAQAKRSIRSATERLPKAERKAKVKRLRTTHFNRPRGGCANCLGSGLKRENRRINPGMSDHEKREALPAIVGLFGGTLDESPCPDCGGQGKDFKRPHEVKTEEAGWFGFIAEEVEKEFPEAVYYRPSEADQNVVEVSGLSVQALVAVLWEEVKDLEERLALAEGKIK